MALRGRHLRVLVHLPIVPMALLLLGLCVGSPPVRASERGAASCGGSAIASLPPTSAIGPHITLSHAVGPAGMSEVIFGVGWQAGAQVSVDLDMPQPGHTFFVLQRTVASGTVSSDGTFRMPAFLIPSLPGCGPDPGAPGSAMTPVDFVAYTPNQKLVATAEFTYTAQPTLTYTGDASPRPGSALPLVGTNWEPGERITITFTGLPSSQAQSGVSATSGLLPNGTLLAHADQHGELFSSYLLPDTLAPRSGVSIQATGNGPLYGRVLAPVLTLFVEPAVLPTIALDRASGSVTDAIVVRGARWYPGDAVQIAYCRGQNTVPQVDGLRCEPFLSEALATVTVDQRGAFSATVHLPSNARVGPITIQALVPNDVFGLAVYAQGAAYQIVPPPVPWDRLHPRLAFALGILRPAVPALALALALLAGYFWRRRRTSRTVEYSHALPPSQRV